MYVDNKLELFISDCDLITSQLECEYQQCKYTECKYSQSIGWDDDHDGRLVIQPVSPPQRHEYVAVEWSIGSGKRWCFRIEQHPESYRPHCVFPFVDITVARDVLCVPIQYNEVATVQHALSIHRQQLLSLFPLLTLTSIALLTKATSIPASTHQENSQSSLQGTRRARTSRRLLPQSRRLVVD